MADTHFVETNALASLGARIERFGAQLKENAELRKRYRTTLHELQTLSDRELADLGMNRSMLRGIAWQAAVKG